jgi:hypothetical protein
MQFTVHAAAAMYLSALLGGVYMWLNVFIAGLVCISHTPWHRHTERALNNIK